MKYGCLVGGGVPISLICDGAPMLGHGAQGCGWDGSQYVCGGSGADPTGTYPIACGP